MTTPIRVAVVSGVFRHPAEHELATVQWYLPSNYTAELVGEVIVITGRDNAGWTLDDYVIPRLASGLYRVVEFKAVLK